MCLGGLGSVGLRAHLSQSSICSGDPVWPGLSKSLQGPASLEPPSVSLWVSGAVGDFKRELPSPQKLYASWHVAVDS